MLDFIGSLVGAGLKYFGGQQDRASVEATNELNRQSQERTNALILADKEKDRAMQKEFAQMGLRWRAEDARAAGFHPLVGVGGATYTPSGIQLGTSEASPTRSALGDMGADVSRAIQATSTSEERIFQQAQRQQQLTRGDLENQLLASQIKRLQVQANPPMPSATEDSMKPPPAPEHSGLRAGGETSHNPYFSDAQKFEDRYGEPGEWIAGTANIGADSYWTLTQSPWFGEFTRYMKWLRKYRDRGGNSRRDDDYTFHGAP